MRSLRAGIVAVFLALLLVAVATEAGGLWVKLGERTVDDRVERDVIEVTSNRGSFTAIRLEVRKHGVRFYDLKVVFGDGTVQDVALQTVIMAGGETRVIDLRGGARVIRRVEFTYQARTIGAGNKALIRLFGRR
jgi:hypothetical protein